MNYIINEGKHDYVIGLKALAHFNRRAYKEIILNILPQLRAGNLVGVNIRDNLYEVTLKVDKTFQLVYGELKFYYEVDATNSTITPYTIEPFNTMQEFYRKQLDIKEGLPITDKKAEFKINLLKKLQKGQ